MDLFDYLRNQRINEIQGELDSLSRRSQSNQQNDYLSLSKRINQLVLVNHALAEIICQRLGISNKEIVEKVLEIDLRDRTKDGKYVALAKDCPKCDAKIARDFNRCLFCGYIDEDPSQLPI
nr:unknown [uncultured bacterium]